MNRPKSSSFDCQRYSICAMLPVLLLFFLAGCSPDKEAPQEQKPMVTLAEHPKVVVAIEPQYRTAAAFSEGLALVRGHSDWSYIDPAGKVVIQGEGNWYLAGPFSEGLAAVGVFHTQVPEDDDPSANPWRYSTPPSDFLSIVSHEQWIYESNRVSREQIEEERKAEKNRLPLNIEERLKNARMLADQEVLVQRFAFLHSSWGYIDKKGEWVIKPQWAGARPFHDGWGVVSRRVGLPNESSYNRKYNPNLPARPIRTGAGYPHEYGRIYGSNPKYENFPFEYSDVFVSLDKPDGVLPMAVMFKMESFKLGGFVISEEKKDSVVLKDKPGWDRIVSLSNFFQGKASLSSGFCEQEPSEWVAMVDTKLSILKQSPGDSSKTIAQARIHKGGENPPDLTSAGTNEGLNLVKQTSGFGFADQTGALILRAEWQDAQPFSCGAAAVKRDGKWGYINKAGELVTELKWDEAKPFKENMAAVKLDRKWGYLKITES